MTDELPGVTPGSHLPRRDLQTPMYIVLESNGGLVSGRRTLRRFTEWTYRLPIYTCRSLSTFQPAKSIHHYFYNKTKHLRPWVPSQEAP